MDYKATILGVSDATHYLVGGTDSKGDFSALPQVGEVAVCQSIASAKQLLREHNVHVAQLTLQSAYDEMCGLPTSAVTNEILYL